MMLKLAPAVLVRLGRIFCPPMVAPSEPLVIKMPRSVEVAVTAPDGFRVTGAPVLLNRILLGVLAPIVISPWMSLCTFAARAPLLPMV